MDHSRFCLGCQKSFTTQRKLHAHEAKCQAYTQWTSNVARSHKRLKTTQDDTERVHHNLQLRDVIPDRDVHANQPELPSQAVLGDTVDPKDDLVENEAGPSNYALEQDVPMAYSPEPPPAVSARSGRSIRLPARYRDYLPIGSGLRHVPSPPPLSQSSHRSSPEPHIGAPPPLVEYRTLPNDMGLFRVYPTQPSFIPKGDGDLRSVVDAPTLEASEASQGQDAAIPSVAEPEITRENLYSAFSSPSAGLLMCWQYSGTNEKSGNFQSRAREEAH
ncbi:hypothetical protein L210DRAFT_2459165 [Boletus edulis BED1]|uniref:Uncharacterized protein n=1 Tax=Boletus edulis BED1 TaxID=1328754 RepID=A0AAD4BPS9_BOLED|nr:hypothetical protein L210DRAFT_2459165 [Boletus edulis BED1]